jgi:hypothetical protein
MRAGLGRASARRTYKPSTKPLLPVCCSTRPTSRNNAGDISSVTVAEEEKKGRRKINATMNKMMLKISCEKMKGCWMGQSPVFGLHASAVQGARG